MSSTTRRDMPPGQPVQTPAAEAFWRFSVGFYACPGVAERCLRLQDASGWDVNLLLFGLWAGFQRGPLPEAALREAAALSQVWRAAAVAPLRGVRRRLKEKLDAPGEERLEVESFRAEIKRIELLAEERQQRALAAFAPDPGPERGRAAAAQALRQLARLGGDGPSAEAQVSDIVEDAKGAEPPPDLAWLLEAAERFTRAA